MNAIAVKMRQGMTDVQKVTFPPRQDTIVLIWRKKNGAEMNGAIEVLGLDRRTVNGRLRCTMCEDVLLPFERHAIDVVKTGGVSSWRIVRRFDSLSDVVSDVYTDELFGLLFMWMSMKHNNSNTTQVSFLSLTELSRGGDLQGEGWWVAGWKVKIKTFLSLLRKYF